MATKYYDFKTLRDKGAALSIIIGIMDDGKSFGMKEDMLDRFINHGERSTWLMNSKSTLEEEISKFVISNQLHNELWLNFEIKRNGDTWTGWYDGELMCYFHYLTGIKKTGRDDNMINTYYDEFNYGDSRVFNIQWTNWNLYLSRNIQKIPGKRHRMFLAGNATSLNIPLLYNYGIFKINKEWTEFKSNNKDKDYPLTVVHLFKRTKRDLDEKYKDNDIYELMNKSDFAKHAFENKFKNDNLDNITTLTNKELKENASFVGTIQLGDVNLNWYNIPSSYSFNNRSLHYFKVEKNAKKENIKFSITKNDTKNNVVYDSMRVSRLAKALMRNQLWYDSVVSQQKVWEALKSFF